MFGFSYRRSMEAALSALRAENTDLRTQIRLERAEWAEERQDLLSRLIPPTTAPEPAPKVRRAPPRGSAPPEPGSRPRRIRYPGYSSSLRPPSPPHMPIPGASSTLTDGDKLSIVFDAPDSPEKES